MQSRVAADKDMRLRGTSLFWVPFRVGCNEELNASARKLPPVM